MTVSIIIPTCHRPGFLKENLLQLVPQLSQCDAAVEIIVTDDSRDNRTRDLIRQGFPQVKWIAGSRTGPGPNRNHGARHATGEWIIFLDDDVIPGKGFLQAYLDAFRQHGDQSGAFSGKTVLTPACPSLLWEGPHNPDCSAYCSTNWGFRREFFQTIGGFDERYTGAGEDVELASRIVEQGNAFIAVPKAEITHEPRPVPTARKLAERWESRVIQALDRGATPTWILWRLPLHALLVIKSRFKGQRMSSDNSRAATIFAKEWFLLCWLLVGWLKKWRQEPRSAFWAEAGKNRVTPLHLGI